MQGNSGWSASTTAPPGRRPRTDVTCVAMELSAGQVAVVTGAGGGIGRALAERFVTEGLRVVVADIDETKIRTVADELAAAGGDVLAVRCDAALADDVEQLAHAATERYGFVDVLCNNAGVA